MGVLISAEGARTREVEPGGKRWDPCGVADGEPLHPVCSPDGVRSLLNCAGDTEEGAVP